MRKATLDDKNSIVQMLTKAFNDNKSVNYVVKQSKGRMAKIESLMKYSFDICQEFGDVFISDNKEACALVLYPHLKKTSIRSVIWDLKLLLFGLGFSTLPKLLKREKIIRKKRDTCPQFYIWFVAVHPDNQFNGNGSKLITELIEEAQFEQLPIYLETSTVQNIPWYIKFGFEIYEAHDFGYRLYFLKRT